MSTPNLPSSDDNEGSVPTPPPPPPGPPAGGALPPPPPPPPGGYGGPPPPPPPGGYGGPPPPPPGYPGAGAGRSNNPLAIVSLVLSLVGLVCCFFYVGFILGIGAVVVGVIANKQIAETGQNGAGMAKAGIIIGAVVIVLSVIWVIFGFVAGSTNTFYEFG